MNNQSGFFFHRTRESTGYFYCEWEVHRELFYNHGLTLGMGGPSILAGIAALRLWFKPPYMYKLSRP